MHHFWTIFTVGVFICITIVGGIEFGEEWSQDTWAAMSVAFGASILTLVGIINTILTGNENKRRTEFNNNLMLFLKKIDEKKRINPDKSLAEVYANSEEKLKTIELPPLKFSEGIIGIFAFYAFLISAVSALFFPWIKLVLGSFLVGLALSVGYVMYCIIEFRTIDRASFIPDKIGDLTLHTVKLDGIPEHFEFKDKKASIELDQGIKRIEFNLRFKGKTRNGFLHAIVRYTNGLASHIPDSNTFLANFGFVNDYNLALLEKELDTGILQIDGTIDLSLNIILRSEKKSKENPIIAIGFLERLGQKEIYKYCSIPKDFLISSIELRIYEDPLFKAGYGRREIDCIQIVPKRRADAQLAA